jgi:MFS transporter, UMF1 family
MYDFANSGYTTVVITAVFNAYFVSSVARGAPWATFAWTAALAVSYALIMITGPLVGAYADAHAAKKKLLIATTVGCVLFTAALAAIGPGELALAVVFIVLSNFFYGSGDNLIAAFLPEIADSNALGKVSGWGWSLGYLGGLTTLGLCLAYVTWAQARGQAAVDFVPVTMLITAAVFAIATIPTFAFLRERSVALSANTQHGAIAGSFGQLRHALRAASKHRDFSAFMVCGLFYQAGVAAVIALAAIYAEQVMRFSMQQTLVLIFVVNITAAIGAFGFGYVQDRIGHKPAVALTLLGWVAMVLLAYFAQGAAMFWLAANIAGLCMGSSQSAGRALAGLLSPPTRLAQFFGLWGFATKFSAILGPITYGLTSWISGGDHRLAILITGSYFLIGLGVLGAVDVDRGRRDALSAL